MERTVLNEYRRNGTETLFQARLYDYTLCSAVRVCFQLFHLGNEKNVFKKIVYTGLFKSGNGNAHNVAAPFLGNKVVFRQLLLDPFGICAGLIHFVYRNYYRNTCRFCVIDCFNRLRHDTVIRRNDEDCDISRLCASRSHSGERFVTGGIKEGDIFIADFYPVSTDGLRDSACLACRNVCVADGIEKRRLAVVNVTHNADDRRTLHKSFRGVLCVLGKELFFNRYNNFL